jgi:CTP:molybdopterin cytidylyltransferase MocA
MVFLMVPAAVLSAGASSRMGRPKALLDLAGEPFLSRIARTLRLGGADDLVVVTGPHDAEIRAWIDGAADRIGPLRVVHNPRHESGQLTSVLAALATIDHPGVHAMLVTLVDLPLVLPATVSALLAAWRASRAPVVRPSFGGRHGHPVVFDRAVFDALRRAPLDQGARGVVHALGAAVLDVTTDDEGVCLDVDTPEDHARAIELAARRVREGLPRL